MVRVGTQVGELFGIVGAIEQHRPETDAVDQLQRLSAIMNTAASRGATPSVAAAGIMP